MISWLNGCSDAWLMWMSSMLWQSTLLIALVWISDLALRRFAWPQLRYALWLLLLIKLIVPPSFNLPTSLTARAAASFRHYFVANTPAQPTEPPSRRLPSPNSESIMASPVAMPIQDVAPALSWQTKLLFGWLSGVLFLSTWLCLKFRRLHRNRCAVDVPEWFPSVMQECAEKLSLKKIPSVFVTSSIKCPAVFGIFRPFVLIPSDRLGLLTRREASTTFIHELSHIKRGDLLVNSAQLLLQILYWPNIFLWLIRRPIHDLRELCCDATVAAVLRENTPFYRQTLLDMARLLIAEPVDPGLGLVSLFERPHAIVTRLNYLDKPPGRQTMRKIITAIVVVTMFFCVLPMSFTQADSKAKDVKINGHMPNNAMKLSTVSEQAKTSAPVEMLAQVQKNVSPKTESTIGDNTTDDSNKTSGLFQPKAGNSGMISQNKDEEIDRPITFELHLFTSSLDALKEALKQNGINNNNIKGHLYGMKPIGNAANSLVQIDGIEPDNRPDLSLIFSMRDQESADLIRILTTDSNFREIDRQIAPGLSGKPIELSISGNQTGAFDMLRIKAIVHLLGNDK